MSRKFDIKDFNNSSVVKFYYNRGRHTVTSLRSYDRDLYVHKRLGHNYSAVSGNEYKTLLKSMNKLCDKLKNNTKIELPKTFYTKYNRNLNCIEKVEKYAGNTLRYHFPTSSETTREAIALTILDQLDSLVVSNGNKMNLNYSIDPTPDNFTYDGRKVYFVDIMPPLMRGEKINPQFLSDKSRTKKDLEKRFFRYLSQKGLYLTFLTKFGSVDVSFFDKLYKHTLSSIRKKEVKSYLYNKTIQNLEKLSQESNQYFDLKVKISKQFDKNKSIDRDMLRLISLYFIKDLTKIERKARKYRIELVNGFLEDKRCVADIMNGIVYSKYRNISELKEFKELVANLIALQNGK